MSTPSPASSSKLVQSYLVEQMQDGWWPYLPGQTQPSIEPTAWCSIALRNYDQVKSAVTRRLASWQNADGGWSTSPGAGQSDWSSSLALLALSRLPQNPETDACYYRGVSYLLEHRSQVLDPMGVALVTWIGDLADTAFPMGWPWVKGSFYRTEPTSYAMVALNTDRCSKRKDVQSALKQAEKQLMDCSAVGGGWNSGNRIVLLEALPPYPVTTGQALVCLQNSGNTQNVKDGLVFLRKAGIKENAVMSLSWTILGLTAHGLAVDDETAALLTHQNPDGSFGSNILLTGLAACALEAAQGHNPLKFQTKSSES